MDVEFFPVTVYRLRNGLSLLPDVPPRHELAGFLALVLPQWERLDATLGLHALIGWVVEAELSTPIQPKYLLLFAAVERLRSRILKGQAAKPVISADFEGRIDKGLGDALISAIEKETEKPVSQETGKILRNKLKELNRPTIDSALEALFGHFSIQAPTRLLSQLRSRLSHTGDMGDFKFEEAVELFVKLSHIVDVCLLKALGYAGQYRHQATNGEVRSVASAFTTDAAGGK
jgi:hypothetical protein